MGGTSTRPAIQLTDTDRTRPTAITMVPTSPRKPVGRARIILASGPTVVAS